MTRARAAPPATPNRPLAPALRGALRPRRPLRPRPAPAQLPHRPAPRRAQLAPADANRPGQRAGRPTDPGPAVPAPHAQTLADTVPLRYRGLDADKDGLISRAELVPLETDLWLKWAEGAAPAVRAEVSPFDRYQVRRERFWGYPNGGGVGIRRDWSPSRPARGRRRASAAGARFGRDSAAGTPPAGASLQAHAPASPLPASKLPHALHLASLPLLPTPRTTRQAISC
jgi:hypothetical protein